MIISIFDKDDNVIGSVSVERVGKGARDFSVEFFLKPEVTLTDEAKAKLTRDMKTIARNQEKAANWTGNRPGKRRR